MAFRKYLSRKQGKNDIQELLNTAILDAGYRTQTSEYTDVKARNVYHGK